ncbi:DUF6056 family protein [Pontibacter pamirensis]|uniref:DUF6056 family protein n=1 Tax=Pontibacter pamirensis TaxID=2562824 RepID=UPI0013897BDB|nr:DUF6056 family protein [Pontibacter pamirensis]
MPHSTGKRHKIPYIIFLGIGLLVLLPLLLLTLYNHPQADDFGFAVRDMTYGFWETQLHYYMNWTGRYFSTTTAFQINPIIYGDFDRYKVYSLLLILLLAASTCLILHKLLQKHFNVLKTSALTALLLCLYLIQLPSVSEGIFWLPGYLTYQLPNIMMLLLLVFLINFFRADNGNFKILYIAIAAMLCVAVVGSNEMSIVMAFTSILFILYNNRDDEQNRPYLLFLFILCVVASLAAVLAPGNYARMEEHPNASKPLWAISYAAFLTGLSFYRWLTPILIASVLYVIYWGLPLADKTKAHSAFKVNLRFSLCYYIATLFLMQFAFTWAVGERPTPRVENVIYFFFVFGWFYNVQVALTRYAHLLQGEHRLSPVLPLVLLLLFILQVFAIDGNIATAYTDLLSGKAAVYNSALNQRYAYLKESKCDTCSLAPLPAIPHTLYFMDVVEGEENSNFWVNIDYADYWGKSAVYLTAPNPEIKDNVTTLREAGKELIGN